MNSVLFIQILVVMTAMLVAGAFGYLLAQRRLRDETDTTTTSVSGEVLKMKRRVAHAEAERLSAQSRLIRERRRQRRRG